MVAKRHDWLKYKQDFFDSPTDELTEFFKNHERTVGKHTFKAHTQGWREEKQAFKKQQADAARAKLASDPDINHLTSEIIKGKANALKLVMSKLSLSKKEQNDPEAFQRLKDSLTMKDLKDGIDILKRELGEPLNITDNKNKNETEIVLGEDFKRLMSGYMGEYKPPAKPKQ